MSLLCSARRHPSTWYSVNPGAVFGVAGGMKGQSTLEFDSPAARVRHVRVLVSWCISNIERERSRFVCPASEIL